MLSTNESGNKLNQLKTNAHGVVYNVMYEEMSIVSMSDRIVTIKADIKIKYAKKY